MNKVLASMGLLIFASCGLEANLIDRYSFSTNAGDSIGGKNGVLKGNASVSGGSLQLDGGGYVQLPDGILSGLNSFSIESWFTWTDGSYWSRLFDFGSDTTSYLFLTPRNGYTSTVRYAITNSGNGNEQQLNSSSGIPTATPVYVALTFDAASTTAALYINGSLMDSNSRMAIMPYSLGSTVQNYLGKSQFSDPSFQGSINEFRIYDSALSSSAISQDALLGPDVVAAAAPEPTTCSLIGIALLSAAVIRRRYKTSL